MRVKPFVRPINRNRFSTLWIANTGGSAGFVPQVSAIALLFAAAVATLTIGFPDPRMEYLYEAFVLALAVGWSLRAGESMPLVPGIALLAISIWGFAELGMGATTYRFVTLQAALRFTALLATAFASFRIYGTHFRQTFLLSFVWFGASVAVLSVLAYFTSPGKILWKFDAPYPDVWGPFLSRNNFAQFLELAMPVALWIGFRQPGNIIYLTLGAGMLAAGLASASRAGAAILVLEAIFICWIRRRAPRARHAFLVLAVATALFAAMAGVGTLAGRLREADPYQVRKEIAHSTFEMISSHPWSGFGLGTFATVYPAYAEFDTGKVIAHAHNDLMEWTAEGGIPFGLAWIALATWSIRPAVRSGWGIGALGFFLHSLVDYPFARIGLTAWVFIFLGMLAEDDLREVHYRTH